MWQKLLEQVNDDQTGLDRSIKAWISGYNLMGGRVFCSKGCSGCCTLAVNCTFTEAARIARELTGTAELNNNVARTLGNIRDVTDLTSYLRLQRDVIGACPFLDGEGACSIYTLRPFSCRALLATKESRWCAVDFSELSADEKRHFVESLDRPVVAFPMHYAAMPQEMGRELEAKNLASMTERFGFSLYGSMPFLVWLETEHRLSELIPKGREATADFLARNGLDHHLLVSLTT